VAPAAGLQRELQLQATIRPIFGHRRGSGYEGMLKLPGARQSVALQKSCTFAAFRSD